VALTPYERLDKSITQKVVACRRLDKRRMTGSKQLNQTINKTRRESVTYLAMLVVLFIFFMSTYRSGDDWSQVRWAELVRSGGRQLGLDFIYDNGRVLGNSLARLTSFSFELNSLVRSLITLGIAWAIARLSHVKISAFIPIITLLVLVPSIPSLRQAIIWSEGFFTHVVPVFLVLLIAIVFRDFSGRWKGIAVFWLSFATGLFVETVTLALLFTAITFGLIEAFRRAFRASNAAFILGSLLGAIVMFSNPGYRKIVGGEDTHREVAGVSGEFFSSLIYGVAARLPDLAQGLVLDLSPLYAIVAGVTIFFVRSPRSAISVAVLVGTTIAILLLAGFESLSVSNVTWAETPRSVLAAIILILYASYLCASMLLLVQSSDKSHRSALLWLAAGGLIASPLILVSPFGPRNFYISAIFIILATLMISAPSVNRIFGTRDAGLAVWVVFGIVFPILLGPILANKVVSIRNLDLATELYKSGATEIELQSLPFATLVHDGGNSRKYLRQLQFLECSMGKCSSIREVVVRFN